MKKIFLSLCFVTIISLFSIQNIYAQENVMVEEPSYVSTVYFGIGIGGNYIFNNIAPSTIDLSQLGFNWDLFGGIRFSPWFAIELAWDVYYHTFEVTQGSITSYSILDGVRASARLYIPTGLNLEPFLRFGAGFYVFGDEFNAYSLGAGMEAGGGLSYEFGLISTIELGIFYKYWYFGNGEDENCYICATDEDGNNNIHAINFVINWYYSLPIL